MRASEVAEQREYFGGIIIVQLANIADRNLTIFYLNIEIFGLKKAILNECENMQNLTVPIRCVFINKFDKSF